MKIKDQLKKIKENWLIVLALLVLFLFTMFPATDTLQRGLTKSFAGDFAIAELSIAPGYYNGDFAPEIEERQITKSTSISSEVKRGEFKDAEEQLKSIITSTDSFLLNENSRKIGKGRTSYYNGYYSIKVESKKYNAVVSQLKKIGEVTSVNENARDITSQFNNLEINLELEKERLKRYQDLYNKATKISDKIELDDRIFSQERQVKYLEDRLNSVGKQVDYSTITFSLVEKQSEYVNIALVKLSELVRKFVGSINAVLSIIFVLIPYALLAFLGWFVYRRFKR